MDFELIHASPDLYEIRQLIDFVQFDAVVSADPDGQNDWMLEMPAECWRQMPVNEGHYVYINGSEWGGPAERVRHSTTDDTVRIYGTCWRGLLTHRAICPEAGQTHAVYENMDINDVIRNMLSGWMPSLISAGEGAGGIVCSGEIRYRNMLQALTGMLEGSGGVLRVKFTDGRVNVWGEPSRDRSNETELSQDSGCHMISERSAAQYDHIIALGQGEMLERTVVELWLLPDGTTTDNPEETGIVEEELRRTLIYNYTAAETEQALAESAAKKLESCAGGDTVEVSLYGGSEMLELGDVVSVHDRLTDILDSMSVTGTAVNITASETQVKYILK